ncbi:MAG: 3-deoxy-manno-octulosonate cytidylyltransferase [Planctomycetota bacterium]|jgi:3-deoxy-manno-octulosonate cytidylyltransferase (CMP-KDO synthetase)
MRGRVLVVIPARLGSTRLPRKVLLKETGKYLVQHVYERAVQVHGADEVVVAADDEAVVAAVESFGGRAVLTSPEHGSGSDRAAEVARGRDVSLIVNLQADEPEIDPADVAGLIAEMGPAVEMGTLVCEGLTEAEQRDPSIVKAVVEEGWAVDFRRDPAPGGVRHLGIYAFRADFLQHYTALARTAREKERKLEQLRALDHGHSIRAAAARHWSIGIDTPEDYAGFVTRCRGGR